MSVSSNQSFFKIYAKNSYMHKINPQFEGIAKKYYNEKREHDKVHTMKAKLDKDIAYLERMEKNTQKTLQHKKQELQYTKEKNNRILNEFRRREWLQELQKANLRNNQEKIHLKKVESERRLKEAKTFIGEHKRSMADLNRMENKKNKETKTIKRAQEWDCNRSRVSEINQFTKNVKQGTDKYFQTRNSVSLSRYSNRIKSYKQFQEYDIDKIKKLQNMKLNLKNRYEKELSQCDQLNKQIERVQKESKLENSLVRSRLKSSSSSMSVRSTQQLRHLKRRSEFASGAH